VDVDTQKFPDYITSVPTLVIGKNMVKGGDVFGYMNNMVQEILQQDPSLGQGPTQQPSLGQGPTQQPSLGQGPTQSPGNQQPATDPVDDLIGWCPDDGCSFSDITEQNDDCAKTNVSVDDTRFSFISEGSESLSDPHSKIGLEQSNEQYQVSEKRQQMDASYERLMAERDLVK